ncbi:MAG: RagB/SusD family nutrient uptake outer membrane protein [Bacteroidetes bacterium]|nr:RagB/SusD family nutrient uptake outer membrane protein [Bacteroidota bacterium]MBL6943110.1 RagB/SusD family nutrient uptake outer membrane protein [Bacteroidales bacterium]
MKKYIIIIIAIVTLTTSCSKFLDEQPQGPYPTSEFFKTENHAKLAIDACYEPLSFANSNNRLWVVTDVVSNDAVKGGFPGDQADIELIDNFQIYEDNGNLETIWSIYYEGISRCNMVLKHVPDIDMDKALQDRILGEAFFIRGYFYFQLCNIFGNIPIVLEPLSPEDMQVPNSNQEDVYVHVETDFISAIDFMERALQQNPNIYPSGELGRGTPGAAKALLSKTYLFQKKWEVAYDVAQDVASYGYSLMPVYQHNFNVIYDNNNEQIFQVQHLAGQSPVQGSRLNQWLAPREQNGYGFDEPTQNFVDEFEMTNDSVYDPRLDYTLGRKGQLWFDDILYDTAWSSTGYNQKKSLQPLSEIPASSKGDADLNFTVIRFAEVLLIQAEALCEMGNLQEALIPLNKVRKRARESYLFDASLPGFDTIPQGLLPDITTTDQVTLLAAIRHERRVELGFESIRYFDIIRYGKQYAESAFVDKDNFIYEIHKVFPIPQSEIETNKNITQNFGY